MTGFIQSILAFIVALGILITFHEFGHFWVARKCGVKILRFSIGFGRPLYKRRFGPDQTEFVIAALPLGGYVKMLDEREGAVATEEKHRSFNNKPLAQRFAIVVAGPVFNFIFAIAAYWLMFVVGVTGVKPVIGAVAAGTPAAQAGLQSGDEIIQVEDRRTPTWSAVIDVIVASVIEQQEITLITRDENGAEDTVSFDMSAVSVDDMASGQLLDNLGIEPERPVIPAVMGRIVEGGAAERAGLQAGDRITAVDGESIQGWNEWVDVVRNSPGQTRSVEVLRSGELLSLDLTPRAVNDDGERIGRVGAWVDDGYRNNHPLVAVESYGMFQSMPRAFVKTWEMSIMTLKILGKMIVGEASVKNLSGPISIAQYAGHSASLGLAVFLNFLAIVSVSLGVLNLLPVPLLDGGHLMYYIVEFIKGSPVSESVQSIGQQVGLALLLCLMGLAFYNDIIRLVG